MYAAPSRHVITEEISTSISTPDVDARDFTDPAFGALEYSVWGHFKWVPPASRPDWCLLFRFSTTETSLYHNANSLGDRTLSVWVHNSNFIHFTTYNFDASSNVNHYVNVPFDYNEFANKWFFIFYGYNKVLNQAFYYLKFEKNEYKGAIPVRHFLPNFAQFRLAKDEWHYAWNGDIKYVQVSFGEGAYRETNFEELIKLKPKDSAPEDDYQGKPEFTVGDKEPVWSNV